MLPKNKIRAIYFCTSCVMFLPKNVHFFCFLAGDCPPHPHPHHAPQPVRLCLAACSLTHNSNEVFTHSTPTPSPSPPQKKFPRKFESRQPKVVDTPLLVSSLLTIIPKVFETKLLFHVK